MYSMCGIHGAYWYPDPWSPTPCPKCHPNPEIGEDTGGRFFTCPKCLMKIYLAQCLCPQRHCFLGAAVDDTFTPEELVEKLRGVCETGMGQRRHEQAL